MGLSGTNSTLLVFSLKERVMLTCVYHPIDKMRVVEEDEAERLLKTGVWFDSPTAALAYRTKVEDEIKQPPKKKGKDQ